MKLVRKCFVRIAGSVASVIGLDTDWVVTNSAYADDDRDRVFRRLRETCLELWLWEMELC